ncbi:DegV family protein [Salinibacillus xinjiangensis]|uniref:DegV family EDD domain-containing protein n=1 Tax=Salinibacillus xinjiangensis TaxID=1229268 RepID=A0A6G1X8J5_9BACI|nr:DegV family protein [Salinibacillus xinjiangensis]MRG87225.1 DegV family EDD domain-containing protein [Salinibacillus xinjiangensis]
MNIQLMTDGGADIPAALQQKLNISIVPLNIELNGKTYKVSPDQEFPEYYDLMREADELPKSSAPSPQDFYEAYKRVDENKSILMLSLSKGVSGTYQSAVIGKDMLLEEQPNRTIEVINTKTASCGIALLLHEARKKMLENVHFHDLVSHLKERTEKLSTLFVLKTLDNLIKGGRLDRVKGAIAKTLNIKLLLHATEEGTIDVAEKVRGNKKAMRRFIEQIGEQTKSFGTISMAHGNDKARASQVLEDMKERYSFKDSLFMDMGPLIATYAGEGGIVISFFRD